MQARVGKRISDSRFRRHAGRAILGPIGAIAVINQTPPIDGVNIPMCRFPNALQATLQAPHTI